MNNTQVRSLSAIGVCGRYDVSFFLKTVSDYLMTDINKF